MKNLFTILFLLVTSLSLSQITNTDIVAKLKIEITDDVPVVTGSVMNKTNVYFSLKYTMSLITHYPDKTISKNSFEELFTLEPKESRQLREEPIELEKENDMIILFLVYDEDDKLIAKDRVVLSELLEQNKPNDGIELLGIVADETKTKFGKDFYDFFYFYYTYYNVKGSKIVKVEEVVSYRRNTQIKVVVGDNEIFSFFSKPDTEFLEEMSKIALQRVYSYLQKLEKENAYITQY